MNLSALGLGTLPDCRIFVIQPILHCLRVFLISLLDRLLWRKSPTFEVVANSPDRQPDSTFTRNQLYDSGTVPQRKFHPQLFRPLAADNLPDQALLLASQVAAVATLPAA